MTRSRSLIAVLATAAVAGASVGAASIAPAAKRPRATSTPSVTLATPDPRLGSYVTFNYVVDARDPRIAIRCYQNDALVYAEALDAGETFQLGGAVSDWQRAGGAAHCTVQLFSIAWKPGQPQEVTTYAWSEFDAAG